MEKILIAIKDEFLSKIYLDFFREEGFEVFAAASESEVLEIASKEHPHIVLLDVFFAEKNDFELLKGLQGNNSLPKIPIILFSKLKEEGYKEKALEFEVKDFIVGAYSSPINLLTKIKTHLGKEKSYRLKIDHTSDIVKELAKDLDYGPDAVCRKCSRPLEMVMIRDLGKGKNYFKVSLICPACMI